MISSFDDYQEQHLVEDSENNICSISETRKGKVIKPVTMNDFEQLWDFWQERTDLKTKLVYELEELLHNPIEMHFEFSESDQSSEANEFRNNLHRIKKIVEALKV